MGSAKRVRTEDGAQISFEIEGSGPPLILLHGITEDRDSWDTIAVLLCEDYQVVRVDLRGHGESDRTKRYGLRGFASDINCVIKEIGASVDEIHLAGHSLGGAVATFVASIYGARSVTNIDQSMDFSALAPLLCPLEPALRGPGFRDTLEGLFTGLEGEKLPDSVRHELKEYHMNADQIVVLGCWDFIFREAPESLERMISDVLRRIETPYLSIHGSDPGPEYRSWFKDRLPHAEIEGWPGLGHWLHRAATTRFVERLRIFHRTVG